MPNVINEVVTLSVRLWDSRSDEGEQGYVALLTKLPSTSRYNTPPDTLNNPNDQKCLTKSESLLIFLSSFSKRVTRSVARRQQYRNVAEHLLALLQFLTRCTKPSQKGMWLQDTSSTTKSVSYCPDTSLCWQNISKSQRQSQLASPLWASSAILSS